MQLLVSVSNAGEAADAVAGGAHIVDAKDPRSGALGAVTPVVLFEIGQAVAGQRMLSAAAGDAADETAAEADSRALTAAGAAFVKVGFAGIGDPSRVVRLIAATLRGSHSVVAVAYADSARVASPPPLTMVAAAARGGAGGILLDTADKEGPALRDLFRPRALACWIACAHDAGLFVAVAGKLIAGDLAFVRDAGADIAGVRGAACDGGRQGMVSIDRVRQLRALCD